MRGRFAQKFGDVIAYAAGADDGDIAPGDLGAGEHFVVAQHLGMVYARDVGQARAVVQTRDAVV